MGRQVRQRNGRRSLFLVALGVASVGLGCSDGKESPAEQTSPPTAAIVTDKIAAVDVAAPPDVTVAVGPVVATKPVSGLLVGMSEKSPADDVLTPVKPAQFRGWSGTLPLARLKGLGSRYNVLLSDAWGYPSENYPNGAGKAPWEDEVGWQVVVGAQVRAAAGMTQVTYEPWNAGDLPGYWAGTEEQLFRTWLLGYQAVRREAGPEAPMAGPSFSSYDPDRITRFLEYCLARGCQVDILTWQEFVGDETALSTITDHLKDARTRFLANPRYAELAIKGIQISEYGSAGDQYKPGSELGYLAALEAGGADAAGRSCFGDRSGASNCYNDSLDGLLDSASGTPNGVWWVHQAYARGATGRVGSTSARPDLSTLAAVVPGAGGAAQGAVEVVVGNHRAAGAQPADSAPMVEISGLAALPAFASATQASVEVRTLPATDGGTLGDSKLYTGSVPLAAGTARLKVPELPASGAAIVTVTPT